MLLPSIANMKFIFVLFLCYSAIAVPIDEAEEYPELEHDLYPRYINFPDGQGNDHRVDLEEPADYDALEKARGSDNEYWLYTRENPETPQIIGFNQPSSVRKSYFDPRRQTIFIAHGWLNSGHTVPNPQIREVYLKKKDVNIITIDWNKVAKGGYVTAVLGVPSVGRNVGRFVNWLVSDFGLSYANVHLIGFSLGAHVVGVAGRETNGKVARITGLDPAGPLWTSNKNRLTADDGVYVEAIHTDGGVTLGGLGIGADCGDIDFYPNGGISQPGCLTNSCNHARAYEYFAASITYEHLEGRRCTNSLQIYLNTCRGESLAMGTDRLFKNATRGSYRVNTKRRYPF